VPADGGPERGSLSTEKTKMVTLPIFERDDPVTGSITVSVPKGKVDHIGAKVELIGAIEMYYDRSNDHEFTCSVLELEPPGSFAQGEKNYPFEFPKVDKQYESYNGINVRLRYYLRVTISRNYASNIVKETDLWVQNLGSAPEINNSIKMEVGIEDCLHIEFEYNKAKYHLKDIVIGKIFFLLVRIKIKHMEIAIIRRESVGSGPSVTPASDTVTKFEIMDGCPVHGESIPVRLFLGGFPLTPTYRNINNKFSVKYYLNLVLVDEEDRRYFKQQEINLWRSEIGQ
jgi:vacuolar protein sorting-associated protein 26